MSLSVLHIVSWYEGKDLVFEITWVCFAQITQEYCVHWDEAEQPNPASAWGLCWSLAPGFSHSMLLHRIICFCRNVISPQNKYGKWFICAQTWFDAEGEQPN